jgi:hypothetical protein
LLHRAHLTLSRPDLAICSSDLTYICRIQVLDDTGSDHRPSLINIDDTAATASNKFKRKTRCNFGKADWTLYQNKTDNILNKINASCIETFNDEVTKGILNAAKLSIPRGNRKSFKPFYNKKIQTAIIERIKARKTLEITPSLETKIIYNKIRAKVKLTVKRRKMDRNVRLTRLETQWNESIDIDK